MQLTANCYFNSRKVRTSTPLTWLGTRRWRTLYWEDIPAVPSCCCRRTPTSTSTFTPSITSTSRQKPTTRAAAARSSSTSRAISSWMRLWHLGSVPIRSSEASFRTDGSDSLTSPSTRWKSSASLTPGFKLHDLALIRFHECCLENSVDFGSYDKDLGFHSWMRFLDDVEQALGDYREAPSNIGSKTIVWTHALDWSVMMKFEVLF